MMLHSERRKVWQDRVSDYSGSKLTAREWCESSGVTENQLRYWLKRLGSDSGVESVGWAPVEVVADRAVEEAGVAIQVGCARIEVARGFDPALLSDVLRVVAAIC
jgi:hypothetical protein